jgi:hypothetical protein
LTTEQALDSALIGCVPERIRSDLRTMCRVGFWGALGEGHRQGKNFKRGGGANNPPSMVAVSASGAGISTYSSLWPRPQRSKVAVERSWKSRLRTAAAVWKP